MNVKTRILIAIMPFVALSFAVPAYAAEQRDFVNVVSTCDGQLMTVTMTPQVDMSEWKVYKSGSYLQPEDLLTQGTLVREGSITALTPVQFQIDVAENESYSFRDSDWSAENGSNYGMAYWAGGTCEVINYTTHYDYTEPVLCGNSVIDSGEGCDDGGTTAGDGCDEVCAVEDGYACEGEPSVCTLIESSVCGDDICSEDETNQSCPADCGISLITEEQIEQSVVDIKATARAYWPIVASCFVISVAFGLLFISREAVVSAIITPFGRK